MLIYAIQSACPKEKLGLEDDNPILITDRGCESMSRFPLAVEEI